MSNVQEVMEDAIASAKAARKKQKKFVETHAEHFLAISNGLIPVQEYIVRINLDGNASLDIAIAGDHHVMNGAWGALRKLGYKCNTRPEGDKVTGFSGWFYKNDWPQIWFAFSSTKCTRKKIGTEMVEKDIYEVVCE